MLAKLTRDLLADGVEGSYRPTTATNALIPQQQITPPQDASYDMIDITSLENLFDNPDMLNWVSVLPEIRWTNADVCTERHRQLLGRLQWH